MALQLAVLKALQLVVLKALLMAAQTALQMAAQLEQSRNIRQQSPNCYFLHLQNTLRPLCSPDPLLLHSTLA